MIKNKLKKQHLPAVVFMVYIVVMCILLFTLPKNDYSSNEKRYLSEAPELSLASVFSGEFSTKTEKYLADHTPGRTFFVGADAYYNLLLGRNGSNGIYCCDDGYLINKPAEYTERYDKNIQIIKRFADKTNAKINVMIAPQTGYVLEDKLPAVHESYEDEMLLDSAESILKSENVNFIRLDEVFKQQSKENKLYYKTDHHWTSMGAYTAYVEYCKANGITATDIEDYTVTAYDDFYGTAYSSSALWCKDPDTLETWSNSKTAGDITVEITEKNKTSVYDSMFFTEHDGEDDKYPIFLDGNHSLVRIKNKASNGKKLLIVKDSYAHTLAPFLADNYSEIVMVDLRYYKLSVSQLLEEEGIEEVLIMYSLANLSTDTDIAWLK